MKLELKSIKHSPSLSEETEAFTADLWVNGKKVAYCSNRGQGGCTDYHPYDPSLRPLLKEVEEYCKTLPPVKSHNYELKMDLEFKIDTLLSEWLEAKDFNKVLIYKTKDGVKMECKWKGVTLNQLLKRADGISAVRRKITNLQAEGCTILNTNLGFILK
ncbi:hypothetical protein AUJ10_03815 [Candidatus Pacearchaeota archaeon CG1_02_31_27]|nr:MAG: hypothetical protein AUJ10_03815 [Candidatus Pacearchaeota archaeon CG1_02_31_27]